MKLKPYKDIDPSNRTEFSMLYNCAGRVLTRIEAELKRACGTKVYRKSNFLKLRKKLEQMAANYKNIKENIQDSKINNF